jgi:hypothetical protein
VSLAGLGSAIASGVVALRYEANVDQAKAAIKGLAGEQKKAAKETAEAYKAQSESFNKHVADFGKGAAIIGGAILVARSGLKAYGEDVRLTAGSSKVNIDALSDSWDGLKTRVELMTLAQAGNRGAWKLTTGQLQLVTDGMRALEKQGFESQKVFDKFTEVLKKGKLEGLDEFGLSVKATGNQAEDLKVLMRALGKEVSDVGGNFDKAGDSAQRSMVRMEDGLTRLRSTVGQVTAGILDMAAAFGEGMGRIIFGPLAEDVGPGGRKGVYADKFAASRGFKFGADQYQTQTEAFTGRKTQVRDDLLTVGDADRAAAQALDQFKTSVNRAMNGRGPLAAASPAEFSKLVAGLPEHWQMVDEDLARKVDDLQGKLAWRLVTGMDTAVAAAKKSAGKGGGRRGSHGAAADGGLVFDDIASTLGGFGSYFMDEAAQRQAAQVEADAASMFAAKERMAQRFADAQMVQDIDAQGAAYAAAERESFLERNFGKIEEFEAYGRAFDTLASVGGAAWGAMYDTIISGEGDMGEAVKKAIGVALGAKARELGAEGLMTLLRGAAYTAMADPRGPGTMGAGAAMMAGSLVIGKIASEIGGGGGGASAAGGASSAAGVGRRAMNYDHRPSSMQVIVGDSMSDDSPRERARRTRKAMNTAHQYGPQAAGVRRE